MTTLTFTLPGDPVAKERARAGRNGNHYTPEKTRAYEKRVASVASGAMLERRLQTLRGHVRLDVEAFFAGAFPREDWDNVGKIVSDGLTKAKVWRDDKQVTEGRVIKRFCSSEPRVIVTVESLAGEWSPKAEETAT